MIKLRKNVRIISALFLASVGSAALAQGLPGSGDGSIGAGFDFDNHYVGSNPCVSSCFGAYGNTVDPLWSVETRDPFGNMTNTFGDIVRWDEDGDGNEENVDMSRFEITVEKLDHVESPDGTIVVVLTVNAVDRVTGESQTIKTVSVTVDAKDITL